MLMPLLNHVKALMAQQAGKKKNQAILLTRLKVSFYFIVSLIPLFFFSLPNVFSWTNER